MLRPATIMALPPTGQPEEIGVSGQYRLSLCNCQLTFESNKNTKPHLDRLVFGKFLGQSMLLGSPDLSDVLATVR